MKKILLIAGLSQSILVNAQVTLTTNELPFAGMTYTVFEDTVTGISPGNSGPGQVWDFTQLQLQATDTINFEDAANSPYANQFTNSNLVSHNVRDSVYAYYTADQSGFYLNGSFEESAAINSGFHYLPPVTIIPVPFSMGSTHISNGCLTYFSNNSGTSFKLVHLQIDSMLGDGNGMLKVPGAVYNNTLRIRILSTTVDSIFLDVTGTGSYTFFSANIQRNIRYSWFRQGSPSYLLGIVVNYANPAITERVEYAAPLGPVAGIKNDTEEFSVKVYPNPASQFIHISTDDTGNDLRFKLFAAAGQQVIDRQINGSSTISLSALKLNNGLYYYHIISGTGLLSSGKLIITD
jgi:hypothetical protein